MKNALTIPFPIVYTKHPSPQITKIPEPGKSPDEIHCMSAMAAGVGTDENSIKNYIGRHPKKKFILVLDEATDLSPAVLGAVLNLEAGEDDKLKVYVIGNANSKSDLHGALSTPKAGWETVSWKTHTKWLTTQKNGICLYFSPYNSPAIHETDPEKKKLLAKFFITQEQIDEKKLHHGENSVGFWRFVLGWWQDHAMKDAPLVSKPFMDLHRTQRKALWSGLHELKKVGGFDPAFSTGGDSAILRLGILGQESTGKVILDFKDTQHLYRLKMQAVHKDDIEIQLADQIIHILRRENCLLEDVAFDCTGQGRAFAELVRQRAAYQGIQWNSPIKIWNARSSGIKNNQHNLIVKTPTELWDMVKEFTQTQQLSGIDPVAMYQFTSRLLVFNPKTKKRELENKQDYRNRMTAINPGKGTSPDEADALSLAVFSAVYRSNFYLEQTKELPKVRNFHDEKYENFLKASVVEEDPKRKVVLKATFSGGMESSPKLPPGFKQPD